MRSFQPFFKQLKCSSWVSPQVNEIIQVWQNWWLKMADIYDLNFLLFLFSYVKKRSYGCIIFLILIISFSNCAFNYPYSNILCNFSFLLSYYLTKTRESFSQHALKKMFQSFSLFKSSSFLLPFVEFFLACSSFVWKHKDHEKYHFAEIWPNLFW